MQAVHTEGICSLEGVVTHATRHSLDVPGKKSGMQGQTWLHFYRQEAGGARWVGGALPHGDPSALG